MSFAPHDEDESRTAAARPSRLIAPTQWRPIGVDDLEPAAWTALRTTGNVAVVAGPGAGKTEFLAQRAAYLLQTGICPQPQRILAISFKRDAAANLSRRVAARVPDHAHRLISMTFDAFTKGLVDRFKAALPPDWRKPEGYDIRLVSESDARRFLSDITPAAPPALRWQVAALQPRRFNPDVVGGWNLPVTVPADDAPDAATYAVRAWWHARYLRPGTAYVDFIMMNRLAELLVRAVPQLRRALRITYPFVFVDEFQDTTNAQFSFLTSVFADGPAVTAVGDSKQRIMGWAGALPKAVKRFTETFHASSYPLAWNFRSTDTLVQLQHVIASRLDEHTVPAVSKATAEPGHDPAVLWTFSSLDREAALIADWIAHDIASSTRKPADFALLARQRIADFEPRFRDRLAAHGISVRNDDALVGTMRLQDLLKNETARLLLGLLRLADQPRGLAAVWRSVSATMARVHGDADDDATRRRIGDDLTDVTTALRTWLTAHPPAATSADDTVDHLISLVGAAALRRYVRSATPGDTLDMITGAFRARLAAVTATSTNWTDALDRFESADAVVLLTAHRSKGLEYHTVFFLGLDDHQWWAHQQDPDESTSTFFVGLSRAAQRLIFTTTTPHARTGLIAEFFTLLDNAGVPEIDHG